MLTATPAHSPKAQVKKMLRVSYEQYSDNTKNTSTADLPDLPGTTGIKMTISQDGCLSRGFICIRRKHRLRVESQRTLLVDGERRKSQA